MYTTAPFACVPAQQKRASGLIVDDCEPLHGCWELNSEPQEG